MSYSISNFKIYDEQLFAGQFEAMSTNANIFNGASRNAISIVPAENKGQFKKESFLKDVDFITRMDHTSVASANSTYISQGEEVSAKLYRKFQIDLTEKDLRDLGTDHDEISFLIGQQIAEAKLRNMRDSALYSVGGALNANSAVFDASGLSANTASLTNVLGGLELMGDMAESVETLVMHSKSHNALMSGQLAEKIDGIANIVAYNAVPATLNRQPVITDSAALVTSSVYSIFGLKPYGVVIEEQSAGVDELFSGLVSGYEQLVFRIQGQYSYNVKVKGYSYTSSTANPINSVLGNSANWALVNSSIKSGAGFVVKVK